MSDLSDFTDSDDKKKKKKRGGPKALMSMKSSSVSTTTSTRSSKEEKGDESKSGSASDGEGADPQMKIPVNKSTRKASVMRRDSQEVAPTQDRAAGILSPPEFFITKIVHDGKCFIAKNGHAVVELRGNIYIYGGCQVEGKPTSDVIKFVPGPNSFQLLSPKGEQPNARIGATLMQWKSEEGGDPTLIMFGGEDEEGQKSDETWLYNVDARRWKKLKANGTGPGPRRGHAGVVSTKSGHLFIFGGVDNERQTLNDGFVLKGDTWSRMKNTGGDMGPPPRADHAAVFAVLENKEYIYSFGGDLTGRGSGTNELWKYSVSSGFWVLMDNVAGEVPCARWKHAVSLFDNRMWISGGEHSGWFSNYTISDFHVFDLLAETWFKVDVAEKELGYRADFGAITLLPSNRALYIFGGKDYYGRPTSDAFRLAPVCTTVSVVSVKQEVRKTMMEVQKMKASVDKSVEASTKASDASEQLRREMMQNFDLVKGLQNSLELAEKEIQNLRVMVEKQKAIGDEVRPMIATISSKIEAMKGMEGKFGEMEASVADMARRLDAKADSNTVKLLAGIVEKLEVSGSK